MRLEGTRYVASKGTPIKSLRRAHSRSRKPFALSFQLNETVSAPELMAGSVVRTNLDFQFRVFLYLAEIGGFEKRLEQRDEFLLL